MLELYIWLISFVSLYVSVFWIIVMNIQDHDRYPSLTRYPFITIAVPAYNEEKTITGTLQSLLQIDYPHERLEILILNDGSKDRTEKIVHQFITNNPRNPLRLITKKNSGKAASLNRALKEARGEYFVVCDADSIADPTILRHMLCYFTNDTIGAVISAIKVQRVNTVMEKIQRVEYIFSSFVRRLMSTIGTLHTTHGVLSVFRTSVLQKVGGFDEHNLTEDFEVAMKLRYHGYAVRMCNEGWNYTTVPSTFRSLWVQRVRWFRGFISNNLRYKDMVLKKKYGLLGRFQIPLELFTLLLIFVSLGFFTYHFFRAGIQFYHLIHILKWDAFDFTTPTFKQIFLDINWRIFFPSTIALCAGLYLYIRAHQTLQESWKFYPAFLFYLFFYPMIRSFQWLHALYLELAGAHKRWR